MLCGVVKSVINDSSREMYTHTREHTHTHTPTHTHARTHFRTITVTSTTPTSNVCNLQNQI